MSGKKIIFIQAEKEDAKNIVEMIGSIEQTTYTFVLLPMDTKLLTKTEIKRFLKEVMK